MLFADSDDTNPAAHDAFMLEPLLSTSISKDHQSSPDLISASPSTMTNNSVGNASNLDSISINLNVGSFEENAEDDHDHKSGMSTATVLTKLFGVGLGNLIGSSPVRTTVFWGCLLGKL